MFGPELGQPEQVQAAALSLLGTEVLLAPTAAPGVPDPSLDTPQPLFLDPKLTSNR